MAHTKGPWALETVKTSCGICHKIGQFPRGQNRKETYGCVYDDYPDSIISGSPSHEILANAKLMAAAPEILDALKMVAEKIRSGDDKPDDTFADFDGEETEQIFAAINRATA